MTDGPRIWPDAKVRIVQMKGWPAGTRDLSGLMGTVEAVSPNEAGTDWAFSTYVEAISEVWQFSAAELELIGNPGRELAPIVITFKESFAINDAVAIAKTFVAPDMNARLEVGQARGRASIQLEVWPESAPEPVFEEIIKAGAGGWTSVMDDRWAIDATWNGTRPGADGATHVDATFSLRPWQSLRRRPIALPG